MDYDNIFCIDTDFDNLGMNSFDPVDRIVSRTMETGPFGDDDWASVGRELDSALGRRRTRRAAR